MRAVVTGMVVLAVLLVRPGSAAAQWRWLEKLSGPGPFVGMYGEVKFKCAYTGTGEEGRSRKLDLLTWVGVSGPCPREKNTHPERRWFSTGMSLGLGVSLENNLAYAGTPSDAERRVLNVPLELFTDYSPCTQFDVDFCRRVEVGVLAGTHLFFGQGPISRGGDVIPFRAKPVAGGRVTVRLKAFGFASGESVKGALKARVGYTWFLRGFSAEDFGALPGSFGPTGAERVFTGALLLDFDRFRPR